MDTPTLNWLSASAAAAAIRDGAMSCEEITAACLAHTCEVDEDVQAWTFLDADHALRQARERDQERREGRPTGALQGIPVGIEDAIDTGDMPTEHGSSLRKGRLPRDDATVVAMLRSAGAVILGKTSTGEFAGGPTKTRNPCDSSRAAGACGSAAAVAAGMVPLALGVQVDGAVIESASYCGVYGYKPTRGLVPRSGALVLSPTIGQIGCYARNIDDIALLGEQLACGDPHRPDVLPFARLPLVDAASRDPPLPPLLAYVKGTQEDGPNAEAQAAFAELVAALGDRVVALELPSSVRRALDWHRTIVEAEMAVTLEREWELGRERLSPSLRTRLARGREVTAFDYQNALARIPLLNDGFAEIFERCDAIITPAALGAAPFATEADAPSLFSVLWTLCGMPAVCLPLMQGAGGLPIGVQLVGPLRDDARLLRTAHWLTARSLAEH